MFDKTIINKTGNIPYAKTVNEFRAPTDESIRLLNEFQEKAIDNLLDSISVDNTTLKAEIRFIYSMGLGPDEVNWYAKVKINGKGIDLRGKINSMELVNRGSMNQSSFDEFVREFYKQLSEAFAKEIIEDNEDVFLSLLNK